MGQKPSKRVQRTSSSTLLTTYSNPSTSASTPTLYNSITSPAPPREITRMSDIIDPRDLLDDESFNATPTKLRGAASSQHMASPESPGVQSSIYPDSPKTPTRIIHSPSGNVLNTQEFLKHPNRPLAMWERQEMVRKATVEGLIRLEAESRLGNRSRVGNRSRLSARSGRGTLKKKERGTRRGCCDGCWALLNGR